MRPTHCWLLVLYESEAHGQIARFWVLPSIKCCAQLVGESSQTVSNWYHGLIRARNALKYCRLARLKQNPFRQYGTKRVGLRRRAAGGGLGMPSVDRHVCGSHSVFGKPFLK